MPDHPEDLSFFKEGEVWLATTSHGVFPGSEEETNRIMNIKGIAAEMEEDE